MHIIISKEFIKEQVKIMREFLKSGGTELTQSAAYNLIAKMYGIADWNTLSAMFKKGP